MTGGSLPEQRCPPPSTFRLTPPCRHRAACKSRSYSQSVSFSRGFVVAVLAWCGCSPALAAEPGARLTLLDGPSTLHLAARAVRAAEGLALPAGTLIATDATCALLRLEWANGNVLDLGPATQVMLAPRLSTAPAGAEALAPPAFYLLRGWAKFSSAEPRQGWVSPALDAVPVRGVAVLQVEAGQTMLFAETGLQLLTERATATRRTLPAGEFLRLAAGRPPELLPRAPAELLARMPTAFRETLPPRWAAFKGRNEVPAEPLPALSYADLAPWLASAEPALRQGFAHRFAARLTERDFRAAVTAHLPQHPEWGPLLAQPAHPKPGAKR